MSRNRYPCVTLEQAETVAKALGVHDELLRIGSLNVSEPVSQATTNRYIYLLLELLHGTFFDESKSDETHYLWLDCPQWITVFYDRANGCEDTEVDVKV